MRTRDRVATVYVGGLWEEDLQRRKSATTRALYQMEGQAVAQRSRQSGAETMHYLHGDRLCSVSVVTDASGAVVSRQEFTPGARCALGVSARRGSATPDSGGTGRDCSTTGRVTTTRRWGASPRRTASCPTPPIPRRSTATPTHATTRSATPAPPGTGGRQSAGGH